VGALQILAVAALVVGVAIVVAWFFLPGD